MPKCNETRLEDSGMAMRRASTALEAVARIMRLELWSSEVEAEVESSSKR